MNKKNNTVSIQSKAKNTNTYRNNLGITLKIGIGLLFLSSFSSFAQTRMERNSSDTLTGKVVVVKAYSPAVSDVNKIQFSPKVIDSVKTSVDFKYFLQTSPAKTHYNVIPIHAAKVLPEPLPKLYNGCLKGGFGTYTSPLAEVCYSSNRSKEFAYDIHLKHQSSAGKIKLENYDEKVSSAYSDNLAEVNGKYFLKPHTQLQAGLRYDRNVVHNYGFNTALLPDTLPDKDDYKQRYWSTDVYLRYLNTYLTKNHFNYNMGVRYNYLQNLQNGFQHTIEADATMNQYYKKELIGGDIFFGSYIFDNAVDSTGNDPRMLVEAKPWVKVKGKKWQIKAGLDIVNDHFNDSSFYHFYPNVQLQFNLVEDYFTPYVGVSGETEVNHYHKLIKENPFVSPNISVRNTDHFFVGSAGLKGKISQKVSYDFGLDYSIINNAYFFINDTTSKYENLFVAESDDIELLTLTGKIYWAKTDRLNFLLKGEYFKYTMSNLDHAWHKPEYKVTFSTYYNLREKFVIHFDVFALGKQYAKEFNKLTPEEYISLDGMVDVNLGVEYRYNKLISAFLNLNNIAAQKYNRWNQYPTQTFNLMGGLMFSF